MRKGHGCYQGGKGEAITHMRAHFCPHQNTVPWQQHLPHQGPIGSSTDLEAPRNVPGPAHQLEQAASDEGVAQLGDVPVPNLGLRPVGVAAPAKVRRVGREVDVKALQERVRPAARAPSLTCFGVFTLSQGLRQARVHPVGGQSYV